MSEDYYVGPFGRILPVQDAQNRPPSPPSRLSRYHLLPPPQKPTTLLFGSDTSLCTPAQTPEQPATPLEPAAQELDTPERQDPMIPVNQLITPSPQSGYHTTTYPQSSSSPSVTGSTGPSSISSGYGRSLSLAQPLRVNTLPSQLATGPESFDSSYGTQSGPHRASFSQVPLTTPVLGSTEGDTSMGNHIEAPVARYHHGQLPQVPQFLSSGLSPISDRPLSSAATFQPGSPTSGTQPRLAHVVDERFIEGEGLCYIYSDGTHCPKTINGQPVNANWGVTKAGKPRKRLALACITCRDKKIKCNPNVPKCDQCQKSGRECRFESAPRGNQLSAKPISHSGKTGLAEDVDTSPGGETQQPPFGMAVSHQRSSISTTNTPDISSQSALSVSSGMVDNGLDNFARPFKRRRRTSIDSPEIHDGTFGWHPGRERGLDSSYQSNLLSEIISLDIQDPIAVAWAEDPYELNPELTQHYLDLYFEHINLGTYPLFPREAFIRWVVFCRDKQLEDNMLLYSILAVGSVFSDRKDRRKLDSDKFQQIARYALAKREGHLTLQVAQTRFILALWHVSRGFLSAATDLVGAALQNVNALGLFAEPGSPSGEFLQASSHILEGEALIECRRRTYWCIFIVDKLESLILGHPSTLREENIFLKLPCSQALFERGTHSEAPFFQKSSSLAQSINDERRVSLHPFAYFIEILDISGDVVDFQFRSSFIPAEQYPAELEKIRAKTSTRAEQWLSSLPPHFVNNEVNMEQNIRSGTVDIFIVAHVLYHLTMLKLNRYCRHEDLPEQVISRNVREIRFHALAILQIATTLSDILHKNDPKSSGGALTDLTMHCRRVAMSVPVIGWGIVSAVDVLSAAGSMDTLPECIKLMNGGLEILDHLARFFLNSGRQLNLIESRVNELIATAYKYDGQQTDNLGFAVEGLSLDEMLLSDVLSGGRSVSHGHSVGWAGPTTYGAATASTRRGDLVYNIPRDNFFRAMGLEHLSKAGNVRWIRHTRTMATPSAS